MMLQATDAVPINFGFTGKGNTAKPEGLTDVVRAGAVGLKLHEDWGKWAPHLPLPPVTAAGPPVDADRSAPIPLCVRVTQARRPLLSTRASVWLRAWMCK